MIARPIFSVAALVLAPILYAQPSATTATPCTGDETLPDFAANLTYDVASIRPHAVGDGRLMIGNPPKAARFDITGVSMRDLVGVANRISPSEVTGPDWINSERFDLHARGDDATSAILERLTNCEAGLAKTLMLRTLLVERTKLVVHRVARGGQGYDLVIAKGGPKLRESAPIPADDTPRDQAAGGGMSIRPVRFGDRWGDQMEAHRFTIQRIAAQLSNQTGVPVTDKTGLTETYDFSIQYCPPRRRQASDDSADESPCPQLVDVIQEQLGLRLEPTKVTIQGIVIDHIEKPSEN